jgi:hypothetical protein
MDTSNSSRETAVVKFPLLRQSYGFPLGGGDRYANRFTLAVNFNCTLHMKQTLHEVLNPEETRVIKRLYGKTDASTGKAKNHFGTYTAMEFADIKQFYDYNDQFSSLVPDGVMTMHSVSTFSNQRRGNTTIISVSFTYTGTMIQQHADIQVSSDVHHDSNSSSSSNLRSTNKRNNDLLNEVQPAGDINDLSVCLNDEVQDTSLQIPPHTGAELVDFDSITNESLSTMITAYPIEATGSYTLYINDTNKIYCVEFFYAFK